MPIVHIKSIFGPDRTENWGPDQSKALPEWDAGSDVLYAWDEASEGADADLLFLKEPIWAAMDEAYRFALKDHQDHARLFELARAFHQCATESYDRLQALESSLKMRKHIGLCDNHMADRRELLAISESLIDVNGIINWVNGLIEQTGPTTQAGTEVCILLDRIKGFLIWLNGTISLWDIRLTTTTGKATCGYLGSAKDKRLMNKYIHNREEAANEMNADLSRLSRKAIFPGVQP